MKDLELPCLVQVVKAVQLWPGNSTTGMGFALAGSVLLVLGVYDHTDDPTWSFSESECVYWVLHGDQLCTTHQITEFRVKVL